MICFLYFIELKIVTLSLQAAYCVYCAAVQIGLKTLVPFMIWSASCLSLCAVGSSSQAAASSRGPASVHLCVCVCVCVCVKRVEPPDCTTCFSLCQQLNVCRALFLFVRWVHISVRNGWCCCDNPPCAFKDCDLPAQEYSMTTQKGGEKKSWVVKFQGF